MGTTIHIAVGNSDDKLTQAEWAAFTKDIDDEVSAHCLYVGTTVHGRWYSLPNEQWQNACWSIEVSDEMAHILPGLRRDLGIICRQHRQDSIAWTAGATEFIVPAPRG